MIKWFRIITIVLFCGFLIGCGDQEPVTNVKIVKEPVIPPASLFNCPDDPKVPVPADPDGTLLSSQAQQYIIALYHAWFSCRTTVDDVKQWIEKAKQNFD